MDPGDDDNGRRHAPADSELSRDIMRYYVRNPDAVDTIEGLARWRLLEERIYRTIEAVTRATAELVSLGLLEEALRPGAGALIGLNKNRLDDARLFAEGRPPRDTETPGAET